MRIEYQEHGVLWLNCLLLLVFVCLLAKGIWGLVSLAVARRRDAVEATVTACDVQGDLGGSECRVSIDYLRHGLPVSRQVRVHRWGPGRALRVGDRVHVWVNDLPPWDMQRGAGRDFIAEKTTGYVAKALLRIAFAVLAIAVFTPRLVASWFEYVNSTDSIMGIIMDSLALDGFAFIVECPLLFLVLWAVQRNDW